MCDFLLKLNAIMQTHRCMRGRFHFDWNACKPKGLRPYLTHLPRNKSRIIACKRKFAAQLKNTLVAALLLTSPINRYGGSIIDLTHATWFEKKSDLWLWLVLWTQKNPLLNFFLLGMKLWFVPWTLFFTIWIHNFSGMYLWYAPHMLNLVLFGPWLFFTGRDEGEAPSWPKSKIRTRRAAVPLRPCQDPIERFRLRHPARVHGPWGCTCSPCSSNQRRRSALESPSPLLFNLATSGAAQVPVCFSLVSGSPLSFTSIGEYV
jgi:hypothetical protein